jgi:hypothetical protein
MKLLRMRRISLLGLLFVLACGISAPPLRLQSRQGLLEVGVQTLGEYPTSLSRIEITESQSGQVIWQVLPSGKFFQIHFFELQQGRNLGKLDLFWGDARTVVPRDGQPFFLDPDTEYKVRVCAGEGLKRCTSLGFHVPRSLS